MLRRGEEKAARVPMPGYNFCSGSLLTVLGLTSELCSQTFTPLKKLACLFSRVYFTLQNMALPNRCRLVPRKATYNCSRISQRLSPSGLFVNAAVFLRPFSGPFFPTDVLVGSFMALSFVKDELRKINSQTQSGGPALRSSHSQPLRGILQRWVGGKENNASSCIFLALICSSRGKEEK